MITSSIKLIGTNLNQRAGGTFKVRDVIAVRSESKPTEISEEFEKISTSGTCNSSGMTIIDNSQHLTILLPDSIVGKTKEFSLMYNNEFIVIIMTTKGSFRMSSYVRYHKLIFTELGYKILSNNNYFYPTRQSQKLTRNEDFGRSIVMNDDTLAIGSKGEVFIYTFDGKWIDEFNISSPNDASEMFGTSLSLNGDILIIGDPLNDLLKGAVYIYKRFYLDPNEVKEEHNIITALLKKNTETTYQEAKLKYESKKIEWELINKIVPNCMDSHFGMSVSLSIDNILLIGAPNDNHGIGAVWKVNLQETHSMEKISPPDLANIGFDVKISGEFSFFTGPQDNKGKGAVWIYKGNKLLQKIIHENSYLFGSSIDISANGNKLIVGSIGDNNFKGAVYVYERDSNNIYSLKHTIDCYNILGMAKIGTSVSVSKDGNVIAIGGNEDDDYHGATWIAIYENEKYHCIQKLKSNVTSKNNENRICEGTKVVISNCGDMLAVGCINDNITGSVIIWK